MTKALTVVLQFVVYAYLAVATFIFVPYYNWQYATTHGFKEWLFLGEVVATVQGAVWPYFLLASSPSRNSASHASAAIDYHNQAALIVNKGGSRIRVVPKADIDAIAEFYRKALAEARQADITDMNRHYPGFGDHFRDDFLKGLELYVESYDSGDSASFFAAQVLIGRWGDWYEANFERITGN